MVYTENFEKAPAVKQQAVINAGFSCFGKNGYQKTAMSEISKTAGVSKASLFHYFGTKKELYLFLYKFSCEKIVQEMQPGTDDFFESIWIGGEIKLRVMAAYPGMYDFLLLFAKEDGINLTGELRNVNDDKTLEAVNMLFGRVNWGKLKPEICRQTAIELVTYISNGYLREHSGTEPPEIVAAELKKFLGILRAAIYKEEYI